MLVRQVPCPDCGRIHYITNHTETRCICGGEYKIERNRAKRPMEIKFIKKSQEERKWK